MRREIPPKPWPRRAKKEPPTRDLFLTLTPRLRMPQWKSSSLPILEEVQNNKRLPSQCSGMPEPPSSHRLGPAEVFVLNSNRVDDAQTK